MKILGKEHSKKNKDRKGFEMNTLINVMIFNDNYANSRKIKLG